jgi:uncharacterized protein
MKKILLVALTILLVAPGIVLADDIPAKPQTTHGLVHDFAGVLMRPERMALNMKLIAFNDSTSTQITVVTVKDLAGYAPGDFAQRLGEKWGIGRKDKDNGILVLVKPKTPTSRGEAFIATGYGLEGVIPDLLTKDIVEREMIPFFRNNDYYGGLDRATTVLMGLASKQFSADQYSKGGSDPLPYAMAPLGVIIMLIIFIAIMAGRGKSNHRSIGGKGLPLWILLSMMNSGRGSGRGSWGGFSGGGGGGGFGGFGGGSFGGGGAGGSW